MPLAGPAREFPLTRRRSGPAFAAQLRARLGRAGRAPQEGQGGRGRSGSAPALRAARRARPACPRRARRGRRPAGAAAARGRVRPGARFGEDQREDGEALFALRAEAPQVAVVRPELDVVEVRARGPWFHGRGRRRGEPRALRPWAARRRSAAPRGEAELVGALRERGASSAIASRRASTSAEPRSATRSVHGETASRDEAPIATRRSAAFRWATAAPYSAGTPARAGKSRPSAVEVRSPGSRPSFDDDEAVRREDERRDLGAELFGRAQVAPFSCLLRIAGAKGDLDLEPEPPREPPSSTLAASVPKRTSCASFRLRGEKPCVPTWSASSRFVLPAPFRPDGEHQPRLEAPVRATRRSGSRGA